MSTHVIKRRAITTPSYRISSGLRCFGVFFYHGSGFASARYTGI